jgi:hypothetical protein
MSGNVRKCQFFGLISLGVSATNIKITKRGGEISTQRRQKREDAKGSGSRLIREFTDRSDENQRNMIEMPVLTTSGQRLRNRGLMSLFVTFCHILSPFVTFSAGKKELTRNEAELWLGCSLSDG